MALIWSLPKSELTCNESLIPGSIDEGERQTTRNQGWRHGRAVEPRFGVECACERLTCAHNKGEESRGCVCKLEWKTRDAALVEIVVDLVEG